MPLKDMMETGSGGSVDLGIDEDSLRKSMKVNRPFGDLCEKVLVDAGVAVTQQTRQLASIICGQEGVSALPFVQEGTYPKTRTLPSGEEITTDVDVFEEQARKLAERADEKIDSPMVWLPTALLIARSALRMRIDDGLFDYEPVESQESRSQRVKAALELAGAEA